MLQYVVVYPADTSTYSIIGNFKGGIRHTYMYISGVL